MNGYMDTIPTQTENNVYSLNTDSIHSQTEDNYGSLYSEIGAAPGDDELMDKLELLSHEDIKLLCININKLKNQFEKKYELKREEIKNSRETIKNQYKTIEKFSELNSKLQLLDSKPDTTMDKNLEIRIIQLEEELKTKERVINTMKNKIINLERNSCTVNKSVEQLKQKDDRIAELENENKKMTELIEQRHSIRSSYQPDTDVTPTPKDDKFSIFKIAKKKFNDKNKDKKFPDWWKKHMAP